MGCVSPPPPSARVLLLSLALSLCVADDLIRPGGGDGGGQVLPFMLRRTKTEVLSDLPPKIIQDYHCDLSAVQQRLYNDFAAKQKAGEMVQDALASAASFTRQVCA